jgi:hypothetical protein
VLSLDEIRVFLASLDDFWKPLFIFLFFTGARIAEAAGLKWKRVDLVNGIVKIRKNIVYVRGKKIYKRPKTESSIRDINVPSAKLTTWDQAMLYFYLAPRSYRKIFFVKKDINPKTKESLCKYYLRTHSHVIPNEVEFWEIDEVKGEVERVF